MDYIEQACNKFALTKRTTVFIQLITMTLFLFSTVIWLDFYITIVFLAMLLGPIWFLQCWAIKYLFKTYRDYSVTKENLQSNSVSKDTLVV